MGANWKPTWLPNPPSATNPKHGKVPYLTQQANPEGTVSGNGIFPPHVAVTVAAIRDGASNTIMIGEQSDYAIDLATGRPTMDIRSCGQYGAWIGLGNTGQQNLKKIDPSVPGTITPYNCTSIAFPINSKIIQTASSSKQSQITVPGLVGIPLNTLPPVKPSGLGNNSGIFSAHAGGANVLFADNRVTFLNENMDFRILLYMGCRDDFSSTGNYGGVRDDW
jgi:prepilin-type processing-associated H-X9-DG protein